MSPAMTRLWTAACVTALLVMLAFVPCSWASNATRACDTVAPMPDPRIDYERIHLAGDPDHGLELTQQLTAGMIGRPICLYVNGPIKLDMTIDVYQPAPDSPLLLHLICPHCKLRDPTAKDQAIHVRQEVKQMAYDRLARERVWPGWTAASMLEQYPHGLGGELNVSTPFGCTWESAPQHRELVGTICDFRNIVIDRNIIRRA